MAVLWLRRVGRRCIIFRGKYASWVTFNATIGANDYGGNDDDKIYEQSIDENGVPITAQWDLVLSTILIVVS